MMTINEVRELKIGDTVVFNGGNSAIVMEIQVFGNGRIEYVLKDKKSCLDWLENKEKTV